MADRVFTDVDDALVRSLAKDGSPVRPELRMLLLACVWFELDRRRDELPLAGAPDDALADEVADRACAALLARRGDYHGQSRFTTWAAKFAIHEAAMATRKQREDNRAHLGADDDG